MKYLSFVVYYILTCLFIFVVVKLLSVNSRYNLLTLVYILGVRKLVMFTAVCLCFISLLYLSTEAEDVEDVEM